jgi:hypothetical protein
MVLMHGLMLKGLQFGKFLFSESPKQHVSFVMFFKGFFFTILKIKIIKLIKSRVGIS